MQIDTDTELPFTVTPDISDRAEAVKRRLIEGEAMMMETLANVTGLPFEFIAAAIAITYVLKNGIGVTIDPKEGPKLN